MACEFAFDRDPDTIWIAEGSEDVAGKWAATDLGAAYTVTTWQINQTDDPDVSATDVQVWATSDPDLFAALDGEEANYDFGSAGWEPVEEVEVGTGDNSGTFAGGPYTYRYWAFIAVEAPGG